MKEATATRIAISLPPNLLHAFDAMIMRMGYGSRSEAIRDAVRHYMLKNQPPAEKGDCVGVISIIYDHDIRGVNDVLVDMQHEYHDIIQSTTHLHLDRHSCMEIVIVKGEAKRINEIKDRLTTVSGVRHTDLIVTGATAY